MNDLVTRAAVGAQVRAWRARNFVTARLQRDDADNLPVGMIVAIIIGVVVLAAIATGVFLIQSRASTCLENAEALTPGGTFDC